MCKLIFFFFFFLMTNSLILSIIDQQKIKMKPNEWTEMKFLLTSPKLDGHVNLKMGWEREREYSWWLRSERTESEMVAEQWATRRERERERGFRNLGPNGLEVSYWAFWSYWLGWWVKVRRSGSPFSTL